MNWIAYNDLAWVDQVLATPESYSDEALSYINALKNYIPIINPTLLHMGCGAGGHDFHFKKHFSVTGVDLSEGMLNLARQTNPEIIYFHGDMRTIDLGSKFDVVAIPDSIAYMSTLEDLKAALKNALKHLKPNGVILIVAHTQEEFRDNNFAYTGEKENVHVTVFENNHVVSDNTYESTIIYLIRRGGEVSVFHEVHTLGLFSYDAWLDIFQECHLKVDELKMDHLYDPYLLNQGEYKLKIFILHF